MSDFGLPVWDEVPDSNEFVLAFDPALYQLVINEYNYQYQPIEEQEPFVSQYAIQVPENLINEYNYQYQPIEGQEPFVFQYAIQAPGAPVIIDDAPLENLVHDASGAENARRRLHRNDFQCSSHCAGTFTGIHKCTRTGKSLKVFCLGDDSNCSWTFKTRNDFNRHCDTVHWNPRAEAEAVVTTKSLLDCPVAGCKRVGKMGFKRKDNLTQHRRRYHGEDIAKVKVRFGHM